MSNIPAVLTKARVEGVLGEYTHELALPADADFAIIYGPNGVGKTKFLEVINAIAKLNARVLQRLPFEFARLEYSNGQVLEVSKRVSADDVNVASDNYLVFRLRRPHERVVSWAWTGDNLEEWLLERSSWRPFDADLWEDRRDGELAPLDELARRFPEASGRPNDVPAELDTFIKLMPSYLIETQRLKIEQPEGRRPAAWQRQKPHQSSRINEQAQRMRQLVNEAQTDHSNITQQLDRTFPNRVLEASDTDRIESAEVVRSRYNEQNSFRSRLGRVAAVALDDALSLPERDLLPWQTQLLSLYLDDTAKKLVPFEGLLQKIELLEHIINSRLLKKRLQVTARDGFSVRSDPDGRPLDLDALSSGEQHEIILMFDLLFSVSPNALVLIDEPEISLHVAWQLAFIPDVQQIAKLANFRFVVATHSPQIINDAWAKATRLGPQEVEF